MSWRVIYITQSEKITLHLDSLVVQKGEDNIKIPLADINTIVVEDIKTSITTKLLNRILEYDILLLLCDEKHNPSSTLLPMSGYYRQSKSVVEQIEWKQEAKDLFWQIIIEQKIKNQAMILKRNGKDGDVINSVLVFANEVVPSDLGNREGLAAKMYFRELFGKNFIRGSSDVSNSGLDYGYTILLSKVSRVIGTKGLLPYLGIHHKGEYNAFNLSCDLVEPFRPIVDDWVYKNMQEEEFLTREHRIELVNLLNARIGFDGKLQTVSNAIEGFCEYFVSFFQTGEINYKKLPNLENIQYNDQ